MRVCLDTRATLDSYSVELTKELTKLNNARNAGQSHVDISIPEAGPELRAPARTNTIQGAQPHANTAGTSRHAPPAHTASRDALGHGPGITMLLGLGMAQAVAGAPQSRIACPMYE